MKISPLPPSAHPSGEPQWTPSTWNKKFGQNVKASHNCYSYMLDDLHESKRKYGKPQPGWYNALVNKKKFDRTELNCKQVLEGVKLDNPHVKVLSLKKGKHFVCPKYHYKGIMMVSPNRDYHFARQDNRMIKVYKYLKKYKINPYTYSNPILTILIIALHVIPEVFKLMIKHGHTFGNPKKDLKALRKWSRLWSHKPGATNVTDKDADGNYIIDPLKANWDYSSKGGINYSIMCSFFSIPSNIYKNTYSTGIPSYFSTNRTPNSVNVSKNVMNDPSLQIYEKFIREF